MEVSDEEWEGRVSRIELKKGEPLEKLTNDKKLCKLMDKDNRFKEEVIVDVYFHIKRRQ